MRVRFIIPGEPVGKGRPRFVRNGHTYTPDKTRNYERLVRASYLQTKEGRLHGAIEMTVDAFFRIPASRSKKDKAAMDRGEILPTKRPDADNILKAIADGLNGVAYDDDAQIVKATVRKAYAEKPYVCVMLKGVDG